MRNSEMAGAVADRLLDDLTNSIKSLPEKNATGSRDFGRGYAAAIRDVLDLIYRTD